MNTEHLKTDDGKWELINEAGTMRKINGGWVCDDHYDQVKAALGDWLKPVVVKDEFQELAEKFYEEWLQMSSDKGFIALIAAALRLQYERGKRDGHNELARKVKRGAFLYGGITPLDDLIAEIP